MDDAKHWFSRATLRQDVPASALRALLTPSEHGARAGAGHRLIWTLFADSPDRARDFLWREAESGTYFLLSQRLPEDRHGLFELSPPKRFDPRLETGDMLAFALRANATVARGGGPKSRGKPCDIVMDALRDVPKSGRGEARRGLLYDVGRRWLEKQGERHGFALPSEPDAGGAAEGRGTLRVIGYRTMRVSHSGPDARFGVLDLEGVLRVQDPLRFRAALIGGLGRAKAFGCGLLLVRRVPAPA
jgi:CRISPR system Cascade subunit CasE